MSRGVLGLVLADLPAEVASQESLSAAVSAGAAAPPFTAAGFECRLEAGASQLDFQLGTRRDECGSVVRFLDRAETHDGLSRAWEQVQELCRDWLTDGTRVHRCVAELWCELDVVTENVAPVLEDLVPSVFVSFEPLDKDELLASAEHVLERLADGAGVDALRRCADACPAGAWVSHVGVMLGRPVAGVRLHVSGVPAVEAERFLVDAGWPGDTTAAAAAMRLLLDHGDNAVLCLDVVGDMLPRIGIECFFAQKSGVDPRWRPLFERLVDEGLASADRAAALLRWPGVLTPADVEWPEPLVVRSLAEPADVFGVVERRLSHVKLTLDHDARLSAKAYFGAGHVWWRSNESVEPPRVPSPPRPAASVDDAIDRALAFLLEARNQGGWWRDFFDRGRPVEADRRITGYASDEWVTAYIGAMLARVEREAARSAAEDALALLLSRPRADRGWGYHALLPADADTTTWVLRLAEATAAPQNARLAAARELVVAHVGPAGGVATYAPGDAAQLETFLEMPGPYDGWCAEHLCVTAAAATLDIGPAPVAFIERGQRAGGSWAAHWWDDDEYATLRAIESLAPYPEHASAVERAGRWAASRLDGDDASPFATALAFQAVIAAGDELSSSALKRLLSEQREDGGWEPSARLRVPAPDAVDPLADAGTTRNYIDDDALFTTATVLAALAMVDRP